MKAHWAFLIFVAGLGAGWLIPHGGSQEAAADAGRKSATPVVHKHEVRPAKTAHDSKWRTFAKELPKLSREETAAFQKSLAPKDRPAAIEALLAQIGPDGIPWQAKSMISDILKAWAGEDFDGAWAWCQQIESDATRNLVATQLLNQLVNKDPDRALALHLEMTAADPNFSSNVPINFLKKATSKDAGSFVDFLGKLPFGNGSSGTAMDFAADFNFQQAADGLTAIMKSQAGKSPPVFPTNFLTTWAARDPDAAWAWFSQNHSIPFNTFGSLLEGIEKQGVAGASSTWAAEKLNEPGTAREAMIRSLSQVDASSRATTINAIAQAMPDTASRDRFLGDVLSMNYESDPATEFSYAFTQMSSPAARLDALHQMAAYNKLDPAKIPDAQLQQWGLTRQQVEQAVRH